MDEEEDLSGLDATSSGDDASLAAISGLSSILGGFNLTNPTAQLRAIEFLDERDAAGDDWAPEEELVKGITAQSAQLQQALRAARERLLAQEYNPREPFLAAAQAFGTPTRTGHFGETIGNVMGAIREPLQRRDEFRRNRDEKLLELDTQMAAANNPALQAQLQLQQMKRQQDLRRELEYIKILGRVVPGASRVTSAAAQAVDRAYAPQYNEWTTGGEAAAVSRVADLDEASRILAESDTISGPIVGLAPKFARDIFLPESGSVQDTIESVVQESLRLLLGAQFTQREGEALMARTFNPRLEENVNRGRAQRLILKLKAAIANERRKAQYFGLNQTLAGFPGSPQYSIEDFYPDDEREGQRASPGFQDPRELVEGGPQITDFNDLSPEEQEAVRQQFPDAFEGQARGGRVRYKRGGAVRRYQEGGRVIRLPNGELVELTPERQFVGPPVPEDLEVAPPEELPAEEPESGMSDRMWDFISQVPPGEALMGAGAGMGLEALVRKYGNPMNRTLPWQTGGEEQVMRALEADRLDPMAELEELRRSRRRGVPEILMDRGSSNMRALTRRSLTHSGAPGEDLIEQVQQRNEGSRDRVMGQVNRGLKPYDYFNQFERLRDDLSANARPLYQAAYAKYPGIQETPEIRAILATPAGQKAVKRAVELMQNSQRPIGRANALGVVMRPSLEFYDHVKRGFDDQIRKEERAGPTNRGRTMRDLRTRFRDYLDQQAPEYAAARQQYAGDLEVFDALQEGRTFHQRRPQELAARRQNMGFAELNAFRTGMGQRISEMIMDPSTDINAAKKLIGAPAMVERLRPFFDKPHEMRVFEEALKREVELFETARRFASTATSARDKKAMEKEGMIRWLSRKMPGFRFAIAPVGIALRMFQDVPQMSEADANRVIAALQKGDTLALKDMQRRARIRNRFTSRPNARRAAAALVGAGAAALMGGEEDAESAEDQE